MASSTVRVTAGRLHDYARVPIAFEVRSRLDVRPAAPGLWTLEERPIAEPYLKDYDDLRGASPRGWPRFFEVDRWGLFLAWERGDVIGAAAVAPPEPVLLDAARANSAVLWDIRVVPSHRGQGVGARLLGEASGWARSVGAAHLAVETQDTNVAACRFYERAGCALIAVDATAYADTPAVAHETMLVWSLVL